MPAQRVCLGQELTLYTHKRIQSLSLNSKSFQLGISSLQGGVVQEIIPIVDKSNYANDPNELKQLGLSRKRAALAVTVLKMLNPENKIYISTEVIVSQNGERGFIVNQFN